MWAKFSYCFVCHQKSTFLLEQNVLRHSQCGIVDKLTEQESGEQGLNPHLAMEIHWGNGAGKLLLQYLTFLESPITFTICHF